MEDKKEIYIPPTAEIVETCLTNTILTGSSNINGFDMGVDPTDEEYEDLEIS